MYNRRSRQLLRYCTEVCSGMAELRMMFCGFTEMRELPFAQNASFFFFFPLDMLDKSFSVFFALHLLNDQSKRMIYIWFLVGCLEGWVRNGNDCYLLLDARFSWIEAKKECTTLTLGANLASVTTIDDFNFVQKILLEGSSSSYW